MWVVFPSSTSLKVLPGFAGWCGCNSFHGNFVCINDGLRAPELDVIVKSVEVR